MTTLRFSHSSSMNTSLLNPLRFQCHPHQYSLKIKLEKTLFALNFADFAFLSQIREFPRNLIMRKIGTAEIREIKLNKVYHKIRFIKNAVLETT